MREGSESWLKIVEAILDRGNVVSYSLAHSARGEPTRRIGRAPDAIEAIENAFELTQQASERRSRAKNLRELRESSIHITRRAKVIGKCQRGCRYCPLPFDYMQRTELGKQKRQMDRMPRPRSNLWAS